MSDPTPVSRERLDAEWIELLNEIRVLLPGVQVLFAFLLTTPFASGFDKVTELQRDVYALALMGALASIVCLVAPTTHHRIRWRKRDKEFMLHVANRSVIAGVGVPRALHERGDLPRRGLPLRPLGRHPRDRRGRRPRSRVFWFALPLARRARDNDD